MEIWEINLAGKGICLYFPRWIQQTFSSENSTQGGPQTFKMEMKQQKPQEEEIPVWAKAPLKSPENTALGGINSMTSLLGDR